jgi:starch-binding outer membrane protein, SusD/RagB family
MRNTNKIGKQLLAIGLCLGVISCKKFVQISPPTTEVVTASVFNNDASATAAQTAIYTQMQSASESFNMTMQSGFLADELTNYSSNMSLAEFYVNSMESQNISAPWINAYNYIYGANAVISGLQTYSGVTFAGKQQLTGEAKFIRAFWYFYLSECYGDVPLATTIDYNVNAALARTPKSQVFQQILADLKDAENLLNPNYIDATDTTITVDRIRPTKWAAAALLARAYLYLGSYDSAVQQSSLVINNATLYGFCGLDSVFLMNSNEAIWQLPPVEPTSNYSTPDGYALILTAAPSNGGTNCETISPQLMGAFEPGDQRLVNWIGSYIAGTDTFYFPYKYKANDLSSGPTEYTMVLRLAEQYLIRAEAEANLGDLTNAVSDLDIIRRRAGLPNISNSIAPSQMALLSAILHERQVELFCEWGHRWFDLIRTGNVNTVMSVVAPLKGGVWSSDGHQTLYPIPLTELKTDPKLGQNPGYN